MTRILDILLRPLREGEQLKNSETWRNYATAIGVLTAVLSAALFWVQRKGWLPFDITTDEIAELASFLAFSVISLLTYLLQATNKQAGIKGKEIEPPPMLGEQVLPPTDYPKGD